jgi:hypothetical protein
MTEKSLCLEIAALPSGGFIVSDMTLPRVQGPGFASQQIFACTRIDEALDFIRTAMTWEAKVQMTDAEIAKLREAHKSGEIIPVDDIPLWRR